ncbi:hypothetical protein D9613_009234 [Agrocybe pediades]|uniref:Uncharacterized protein n=1 Tax=Agrocybe pediades TaxID=84607 RepID=A0A8H4VU28_9AGAR|nr:hypothetical protein D9613_009234 [Agrocybe pediades]
MPSSLGRSAVASHSTASSNRRGWEGRFNAPDLLLHPTREAQAYYPFCRFLRRRSPPSYQSCNANNLPIDYRGLEPCHILSRRTLFECVQ